MGNSEDDVKPHWWVLSTLLLWCVCALAQVGDAQRPFIWTKQDYALPESIEVFAGVAQTSDGLPVRAWYADVDLNDKSLHVAPHLSPTTISPPNAATPPDNTPPDAATPPTTPATPPGKEPASAQATRIGALVAINGGYFDVSSRPAKTYSLVRRDGVTLADNIGRVVRGGILGAPGTEYFVTRSALGFFPDGTLSFAWVRTEADGLRAYAEPNPNARGVPALLPDATQSTLWNPPNAIGAGPRLLQNGQVRITYDEEAFFGSGFGRDNPYPRAAVGQTANNHLILFATDGKQPEHSVGLSLPQLAEVLKELGCVDAMNLDGGGSETLVVNGVAVNKPSDATGERPVTSILAIVKN